MNRHFEGLRLKGLGRILQECQNGRTIHEIKNVRATLQNWETLLSADTELTHRDYQKLGGDMERAYALIRREKRVKAEPYLD